RRLAEAPEPLADRLLPRSAADALATPPAVPRAPPRAPASVRPTPPAACPESPRAEHRENAPLQPTSDRSAVLRTSAAPCPATAPRPPKVDREPSPAPTRQQPSRERAACEERGGKT